MPAKSKARQEAAGATLAVTRGEAPEPTLNPAACQLANRRAEQDLEKLASARHRTLPEKKTPG